MGLVALATECVTLFLTEALHTTGKPPVSYALFDNVTAGFVFRVLPRDWGIARLPCQKATVLDLFKEGDFDYPYNLKQVGRVGAALAAWFSVSYMQPFAAEANCLNRTIVHPLRDAVYFEQLQFSYQAENLPATLPTPIGTQFAAIRAAEDTLVFESGRNISSFSPTALVAVQAASKVAIAKFFAMGGGAYNATTNTWSPQTEFTGLGMSDANGYVLAAMIPTLDASTLPLYMGQAVATSFGADELANQVVLSQAFGVYLSAVAQGQSTADAAAAFALFVGTNAPALNSANYGAYLSTADTAYATAQGLAPWITQLGVTLVTAVKTMVTAQSQTLEIGTALGIFGFNNKASYGTHYLKDVSRQTTVKAAVDDALSAYTNALINPPPNNDVNLSDSTASFVPTGAAICAFGNTDVATLQGQTVHACTTPWSSTFLLNPGLITGDVETDEGYNITALPPWGIRSLKNHRMVLYTAAWKNGYFVSRMNAKLGMNTTYDQRKQIARDFESTLRDYLKPFWTRQNAQFAPSGAYANQSLSFLVDRGTADIIEDATDFDDVSLSVCYVLMALYIGLTVVKVSNTVESHFFVAIAGVLVIALAVAASLGFSSYIYIKATPLASQVVPFVALGLGVDDMLVLLQAHVQLSTQGRPLADVLPATLAEAGPSVLFTSVTNIIAFLIASTTPINVVAWFSEMLVVAVVCNWIFLMTLFLPVLVVDTMRTANAYREFVCCSKNDVVDTSKATQQGALNRFAEYVYAPFLMKPASKAAVVVVFTAFFSFQTYRFFAETEQGIRQSDIVLDGSYQKDFFVLNEENFVQYGADFTTKSTDFSDTNVQLGVMMAYRNLNLSPWVDSVGGAGTMKIASPCMPSCSWLLGLCNERV